MLGWAALHVRRLMELEKGQRPCHASAVPAAYLQIPTADVPTYPCSEAASAMKLMDLDMLGRQAPCAHTLGLSLHRRRHD
jgi:hypothetical protein